MPLLKKVPRRHAQIYNISKRFPAGTIGRAGVTVEGEFLKRYNSSTRDTQKESFRSLYKKSG